MKTVRGPQNSVRKRNREAFRRQVGKTVRRLGGALGQRKRRASASANFGCPTLSHLETGTEPERVGRSYHAPWCQVVPAHARTPRR